MRMIDADVLLKEYDRVHVGPPGGARKLIEDAPTVGETTRPVFNGRFWECEECGHEYSDILVVKKYSYCPWCGRRIEWQG